MPVTDTLILLMFLMVVAVSCTAYFIVKIGATRKWDADKIVRRLCIGLYIVYAMTLFVLTLVARDKRDDGLIYWIPFENIYFIIENGYPWYYDNIILFDFLNIVLFLPFGFLGGEILRGKIGFSVLAGFCISLLIELTQLFTQLGVFDVNDILYNTLGALLGCGLFALCRTISRKIAANRRTV